MFSKRLVLVIRRSEFKGAAISQFINLGKHRVMSLRKLNFALSVMSVFAITQFTTYVALASDDACMDHSARIAELERKVAEIEKRLGQVPTVGLGQMVRHSDGSVHRMTHAEALSYCSARGGLPTAKQLALLLNTKGLSDKPLQGFPKYSPKNETPFYYSHASYERPEGDEGVEWL